MTADELKALRKDAKLTALQLAEKVGMTVEHISRLENGHRRITTKTACAMKYAMRSDRLTTGDRDE